VPTVLLIDDDQCLLAALEAIVQQAGFCVVIAKNGVDALKAVHAKVPDAIVSDLMMPVMNGVELWRLLALHPVYSSIPFLLQSAVEIFPSDVRPTAFLRKPYSPTKLLEFLERWTSP
jgi:CheY-like chemotaxis protein